MSARRAGDTARDQVARLLVLVPFLHARGEVSVAEAAEVLGIDREQLVKDLKVLFMCGLPGGYPDDLIDVDLEALEGEGVIRVDNADYLARPVRFTPTEATALVVALRTMAEAAADTREVVERTIAKLERAGASAADRVHVADARPAEETADAGTVELLQGAIDRGHQVRLTYYVPTRDEETERVVDPRAVIRVGAAAYLDAWCHTAQDDRSFRVDRIQAAEELTTQVADPGARGRDLSAGWLAEGATRVTLRLAPPAQWIPEYYPVVASRPGPDGTLDVDLDVAGEPWLRQLVLRVAPHATVLGPQEFADSFHETARSALGLYPDRA
jgi:proteasome accessory factor C